jgi:hypothetical protein
VATDTSMRVSTARAWRPARSRRRAQWRPRWPAEAWWAIAAVTLFVAITWWWLTQDRTIPVFDAGLHLSLVVSVYEELSAGHVGKALTLSYPYPPFSYLVGALGLWIGGMGVASPIVAQNLVFLPLLALGCYHAGRLAFDARTGLLAVVFALGSPLMIAQFHVFMTDAPETAMVAIAVWLLLASERFSRVRISAAAGVAVGLGVMTKEPFPFFVAGVILVMIIRGGWRSWRGLLAFALPALAIALPWYINALSHIASLAQATATSPNSKFVLPGVAPARFSGANLMWYFWNITNFQLYAPLFVLALIGGAWTLFGFVRRRPVSPLSWELAVGAAVAWLAITETYVHDTRYSMPLLLYLAVFGSCWIGRLARGPRLLATGALMLVAIANTLGTSFGVGRALSATLPGAHLRPIEQPGRVTLYSNAGFLVSAPKRDGDVLALLRALRRDGTRVIAWVEINEPKGEVPLFSEGGLMGLTRIAQLKSGHEVEMTGSGATAILGHAPLRAGEPPPCTRLEDGTGVWVQLGDPGQALKGGGVWMQPNYPERARFKDYCPFRTPPFYAVSG